MPCVPCRRIDFEEFFALMKKFEPRIQPTGVRKTLEKVCEQEQGSMMACVMAPCTWQAVRTGVCTG